MSGSALGFLDGHRKLLNGDLDRALADCLDDLFLSLEVLPRRPEAKLYYRQTKITTMNDATNRDYSYINAESYFNGD